MDSSMYDAETIIRSLENGKFCRIYGRTGRTTPKEILTQMDTIVLMLNTSIIPACHLEIDNFNHEEKEDFFEKIKILQDMFGNIADLKDKRKKKKFYVHKCWKCHKKIHLNISRDIQNEIQLDHFDELLSNTTQLSELTDTMLDIQNPISRKFKKSVTNCSCNITLPTSFKFDFNVTYFKEVEPFYHITDEFHNDSVCIDGTNYYTLRILDENMFLCFLCDSSVSIKNMEVHLKGKRHNYNKISQLKCQGIVAFHKNWMNQELLFQIHQLHFTPCNENIMLCQLCSSNLNYVDLQSHILIGKHKNLILERLNVHPKINYLQLQSKVYTEVVDPAIDQVDDTVSNSLIDLTIANEVSNDLSHIAPKTCNNCLSFTQPPRLEFNFKVAYHSTIESLIYNNMQFADVAMPKGGVKLHTIQLKNSNECVCLLCCCSFNIKISKEHIEGQKHLNKLSCDKELTNLDAYHNYWIGQEVAYQAHQVYFYPSSDTSLSCHRCNNLNVFYDIVHNHIKDERHKQLILQEPMDEQLIILQQKVYKVNDNSSDSASYVDSVYVKQSVYQNNANDECCSDINNDTKPSTSTSVSNSVEEGSENSESECENEDELLDQTAPTGTNHKNVNKEVVEHEIVKAFDTDSPNELHTLIQRRFWPHFVKEMEISQKNVTCRLCKVTLSKNHDVILCHVTSPPHTLKALNKMKYKLYCDVCNTHISKEITWLHHLKSDNHKDRCQKLGVSRQQKLTEYECLTCHFVIFGDSMSIKRHSVSKPSKGKRSITLNQNIKNNFNNENNIVQLSNRLVKKSVTFLQNDSRVKECCRLIKETLMEFYPNCDVYPFGSQVSGLGSLQSDLDLFVDLGDMYFGNKNQDSLSQAKFVNDVKKILVRQPSQFKHINAITTARTPIIQVFHVPTQLDCDLSFRHGLSVENTKFLRLCIEVQPTLQQVILVLKQWSQYSKLTGHITSYSLSMMVIFFYQTLGYLIPVHKLMRLASGSILNIDGWDVLDFDSIASETFHSHTKACDKSLKQLLLEFFRYYSNFNYKRDVICPLLGHTIEKSLFDNAQGFKLPPEMFIYVDKISRNTTEHFRAESAMCIQDPFDLSHNLTKGCSLGVIQKFIKICNLTYILMSGK